MRIPAGYPKFDAVPIVVNGRTLLPLRDLLVSLGVQNDNEHIIWNAKEKSITVIHDMPMNGVHGGAMAHVVVKMTIGSTKAKIGNYEPTLDAAPVLYKGKTYLPARFVAEQCFNMPVEWDGATNTIKIYSDIEKMMKDNMPKE